MKTYSFGIVWGRRSFPEMTVIRIVKIIFVIDETTEAATCKMFVTNTIVDIYEQKV